mmetsp:Transcript_7842/g.15370  ORF Transcript_7842/g.15370 Transcript_7842/m.15370 type:complete len:116 (-) Transcript_7842:209-556(-)
MPFFWKHVFENHPVLRTNLEEVDEEILEYMVDLTVEENDYDSGHSDDEEDCDEGDAPGFFIHFVRGISINISTYQYRSSFLLFSFSPFLLVSSFSVCFHPKRRNNGKGEPALYPA